MSLGKRLKELRLHNKLSQEKLAIKLDVATHTYINYETGKKNPSIELLTQMAEIFGVSISFLMDDQNESAANTQAQKTKCGILKANQLVDEINGLFAGDELSEIEKASVIDALQEGYRVAKSKSK